MYARLSMLTLSHRLPLKCLLPYVLVCLAMMIMNLVGKPWTMFTLVSEYRANGGVIPCMHGVHIYTTSSLRQLVSIGPLDHVALRLLRQLAACSQRARGSTRLFRRQPRSLLRSQAHLRTRHSRVSWLARW